MSKINRANRGQFVIITALIIAALTIATTISIQEISIHRQSITYRPVDELLLGTTSDLERALTYSLSKYSKAIIDQVPSPNDSQFVENWTDSLVTSFSSNGLLINEPILPIWDCHWNGTTSYSLASVMYNLDVDSYGFKGWIGRSCKYVQLQIFNETINSDSELNTTSFIFALKESSINEDATVPISELSQNPDLQYFKVGNYNPIETFVPATEVSLKYEGNGNYSVTFNQKVDLNGDGIRLDLATPSDKIWVSANYFENLRDWSTLHLITGNNLQPNYLYVPESSSFYTPTLNQGHPSIELSSSPSNPTPKIVTENLINITIYLSSTPPKAAKTLSIELGFTYLANYYLIGATEIDVSGKSLTAYSASINAGQNPFVPGFGVRTIPQGSTVQLNLTVSFSSQSGSGKVYFDGTTPSQINLY